MMLNAEALRNLLSVDEGATSRETRLVSQNSIEIACHLLDLAFSPEGLGPFLVGFQNNQFIMICHAATEILQVRAFMCFCPVLEFILTSVCVGYRARYSGRTGYSSSIRQSQGHSWVL